MVDQCRSIVVVHGVGVGSDADRAGFSLELARRVETFDRGIKRVGRLPGGELVPRDVETTDIVWEEALWESVHDTEDEVVKALLTNLGATSTVVSKIAGYFLDLMLDTPLYLTATGKEIRRRVRAVIAAHPGCIVVGHSLGSVIAGDVIARSIHGSGKSLDVGGFVTMGSPINLLGLRKPLEKALPLPFRWENFHYDADPICFGGAVDAGRFPGVKNFELSKNEGFGVAHTHYWASQSIADSVRGLSTGE